MSDKKKPSNDEPEKKKKKSADVDKKSAKGGEKSSDNRNLSAYQRIAKKVDAAGIQSSKTDMKSSAFKVTAHVAGTISYMGILEMNDANTVALTCKRPRSSKTDTIVISKSDILTIHGTTVGKATQIVATSEELLQEVVGKVSYENAPIVRVKCEDGSVVDFNTSKVRLEVVKM